MKVASLAIPLLLLLATIPEVTVCRRWTNSEEDSRSSREPYGSFEDHPTFDEISQENKVTPTSVRPEPRGGRILFAAPCRAGYVRYRNRCRYKIQ